MLPQKICFVDIETTGMSPTHDRIIEIGILRVENNRLVKTYHNLLDPQISLSPEITLLTGIKAAALDSSPSFRQIKDELREILEGSVMVAHNVRFDYAFLKNEFKKVAVIFSPKHFCTAKLSRHLFPRYHRHDLSTIIERFNLSCVNRHRAFDDAKVLWDFYQILQQSFPETILEKAINLGLKRPTVPIRLNHKILKSLPECPGVYIFYGENDLPLYIGKSTNIKHRVLSHFSSDHLSSKEMKIARGVLNIETVTTTGELGALLLESSLIKKHKPLYNRMLRYSNKLVVIKEVQDREYKTIKFDLLENINRDELTDLIGTFKSIKQAKQFLIATAKEHNLCPKLLGLESTRSGCFAYRLGRCKGACIKKETAQKYNLRFIEAFISKKIKPWPFAGPIMIEGFMVDKWCVIDKADETPYFDVDSYKIINRYLKQDKNIKKIKRVNLLLVGHLMQNGID